MLLTAIIDLSSLLHAQSPAAKTSIYIVRPAEKDLSDPKNPDPNLSMEGNERSKSLTSARKKEKFAAIFSSKYKRTTQSESPIAEKNNLYNEFYHPADPRALAELSKFNYTHLDVHLLKPEITVSIIELQY